MEKKIRILSIDGGGIRGIIPAIILQYIEQGLQKKTGDKNVTLADYFDLIAGTSTGGILACFYLLPSNNQEGPHSRYFAREAIEIYAKRGEEIFDKKWYKSGLAGSIYPAEGIEGILKEKMGDTRLSEARKHCLITSYDITERKAVLFTMPQAKEHDHRDYYMRDVARATSAAPTYFELATITSMGGATSHLIDGAMYAGNPTMCAIVEANKTIFDTHVNPEVSDLFIVSVGAGKERYKYDHKKAKNWGVLGWARPVVDILLSASAEVIHYQVKQLFDVRQCEDCYARLEPELGKAKPDMDDASGENIKQLKEAGNKYIRENAEALDKIVEKLIENS